MKENLEAHEVNVNPDQVDTLETTGPQLNECLRILSTLKTRNLINSKE